MGVTGAKGQPQNSSPQNRGSGQVEHDLDGARLGGARGAVEGGRDVLGREAEAVRDERQHVHLLAGHQVQAERVLQKQGIHCQAH